MVQLDPDISLQVARLVSEGTALDEIAAELLADAKSRANGGGHQYVESMAIEKVPGKKGVVDRHVTSGYPWIEFGHVASGWYAKIAPGRWIPGVHALRNAAIQMRRKVGDK